MIPFLGGFNTFLTRDFLVFSGGMKWEHWLIWLITFIQYTEVVAWRCSGKKNFLRISQNSQENTPVGVLSLQLCYKRDSNTSVFL